MPTANKSRVAPREESPLLPGGSGPASSAPLLRSSGNTGSRTLRHGSTAHVIQERLPMVAVVAEAQEGHVERARLDQACYHLQDALDGISREHPIVGNHHSRSAYALHVRLSMWFPVVAALYILLGVFEEPLWSRRHSPAAGPPLYRDAQTYPSFGVPLLRHEASLALELVCLALLAVEVALQVSSQGWRRYARVPLQAVRCSLLVLGLLDLVVAVATGRRYWRAIPYVRAALLAVHWPPMLRQMELARNAAPKFLAVLLLLVAYLCFSSWIATLVFPLRLEGDEYLGEWSEATWELLVLLTTANFPKVMMPAYTRNRGYALFFVPYVCFGIFFLLNYVLAVVYSAYTAQQHGQSGRLGEATAGHHGLL